MKNILATENHVANAVAPIDVRLTTVENAVAGSDGSPQGGTVSLAVEPVGITPLLAGDGRSTSASGPYVLVSSRAATTDSTWVEQRSAEVITVFDQGRSGVFEVNMAPVATYICYPTATFPAGSAIVGGLVVKASIALYGSDGLASIWDTPLYVTPTVTATKNGVQLISWAAAAHGDSSSGLVVLSAGVYTCEVTVTSFSLGPTPYKVSINPQFYIKEHSAYMAKDVYPPQ